MEITVKSRNYTSEVTIKTDNVSVSYSADSAEERVKLCYDLVNAADDVLNKMVTSHDEEILEIKSKLVDCLEDLGNLRNVIKK